MMDVQEFIDVVCMTGLCACAVVLVCVGVKRMEYAVHLYSFEAAG